MLKNDDEWGFIKSIHNCSCQKNAKVCQCQLVDSGQVGRMAEWMVIRLDSCDKYLHDIMIMTKIIDLLQPDFTRARVVEPLVVTVSDSRHTAVYAHLPFLEGERANAPDDYLVFLYFYSVPICALPRSSFTCNDFSNISRPDAFLARVVSTQPTP